MPGCVPAGSTPHAPGSSGRSSSRCPGPPGTRTRYRAIDGSAAREAEDVVEHQGETPIAAAKEDHVGESSSSGATSERSSSTSTTKITSRIAGMITLRSRAAGVAGCRGWMRGVPADPDVRAHRVQVGAQRAAPCPGGLRESPGAVQRGLHQHVPVHHLRRGGVAGRRRRARARRPAASTPACCGRRERGPRQSPSGDDDRPGCRTRAVKCAVEHVLGLHRVHLGQEGVGLRRPGSR